MNLHEWYPALTTTVLASGVAWIFRKWISTKITKSIEHEFNVKLEHLRADLREADEKLKADLREKETEISLLRTGALNAMASRQIALDKRKLEAIDQLWTAFNSLSGARFLTNTLAVINFKEAAKQSKDDIKTRDFFESIGGGFDPKTIDHTSASKAKPFVSDMAWATYIAYMAICLHAVMRWQILRFGMGEKDFTDSEAVKKLIVTALPTHRDYINKIDSDNFHIILDALEAALLKEIKQMLSGAETNQANIEQAAEIVRQSSAVIAQASKRESP